MSPLLSAFCLLFALSCNAPGIFQDAGGGQNAGTTSHVSTSSHSDGKKSVQQLSVNNENGSLMLALHGDGRATAIVDGEVVPSERLVREGDHLRVNDGDGNTLFDVRVLENNGGIVYPYDSKVMAWNEGVWGPALWVSGDGKPRKMIGVTSVPAGPALAAQLGLQPEDALVISEVGPDMPAEKAGLKVYDVVLKIDGEGPPSSERLRDVIRAKKVGDVVKLKVVRKGEPMDLEVPVEEIAPERLDAWNRAMAQMEEGAAGSSSEAAGLLARAYAGADAQGADMAEVQEHLERARAELDAQKETLRVQLEQLSAGKQRDQMWQAQEAMQSALERVEEATAALKARQAAGDVGFLSASNGTRSLWVPSPAPPAQPRTGAEDQRLQERFSQVEERMKRLEEMLQKLIDSSGKPAAPSPSEGNR
jgi:hypothetical protein